MPGALPFPHWTSLWLLLLLRRLLLSCNCFKSFSNIRAKHNYMSENWVISSFTPTLPTYMILAIKVSAAIWPTEIDIGRWCNKVDEITWISYTIWSSWRHQGHVLVTCFTYIHFRLPLYMDVHHYRAMEISFDETSFMDISSEVVVDSNSSNNTSVSEVEGEIVPVPSASTSTQDKEARTYKCSSCDYTTKSKANICHHRQSVHMKKRKHCSSCEKSYSQSYDLQVHVKATLTTLLVPKVTLRSFRAIQVNRECTYLCFNCNKRHFLAPVLPYAVLHCLVVGGKLLSAVGASGNYDLKLVRVVVVEL